MVSVHTAHTAGWCRMVARGLEPNEGHFCEEALAPAGNEDMWAELAWRLCAWGVGTPWLEGSGH